MTEDRGELDLTRRIEELEKSLSIALEVNDTYQRENVKLKKRAQEAEGENTIIKGIGNSSPEMKALQARVKQLEASLTNALEINESHQRYNGKLQIRVTEVEADNQRLAHQVEDKVEQLRKSGL